MWSNGPSTPEFNTNCNNGLEFGQITSPISFLICKMGMKPTQLTGEAMRNSGGSAGQAQSLTSHTELCRCIQLPSAIDTQEALPG